MVWGFECVDRVYGLARIVVQERIVLIDLCGLICTIWLIACLRMAAFGQLQCA